MKLHEQFRGRSCHAGPVGRFTAGRRADPLNSCCLLLTRRRSSSCSALAEVIVGAAGPSIVERANLIGADLLVVGSHGRRGFRADQLGSVAETCLRTAECSVMLVQIGSQVTSCTLDLAGRPVDPTRIYEVVNRSPFERNSTDGFVFNEASNTIDIQGATCDSRKQSGAAVEVVYRLPARWR